MMSRILKILVDYSTSMAHGENLLLRTENEIIPHLKSLISSSSEMSLEYFSQDISSLPDPLPWDTWEYEKVVSVVATTNRPVARQTYRPHSHKLSLI